MQLDCAQLERLGLAQRWRSRAQYTLIDASFGDGRRFLQLWDLWLKDPARPDRLHVVGLIPSLVHASVLRGQLLARESTHLSLPAEQLLRVWPVSLPGIHRLDFEGMAVTLTLAVGPFDRTVPRLAVSADAILFSDTQALRQEDLAQVWREALPRLVRDQQQAFIVTQAGMVTLDSSVARTSAISPADKLLGLFQTASAATRKREAIVVGAGVAGAGVAHALAIRGWRVRVIDSREGRKRAHGAHLAAALTPMVTRDDDLRARLSRAGSLRAQARWSHLSQEALWRCGALQLQRVDGRIVDLAAVLEGLSFPEEWVRFVDAEQASAIAGLPLTRGGLYFSTAARIQPERLLEELLATPGVEHVEGFVHTLRHTGLDWQVQDECGRMLGEAPQLILANAFGTQDLLRRHHLLEQAPRLAAMHRLGGEITLLPADLLSGGPRCIVSGDGYILPALEGKCVVGSTYVHGAEQIMSSSEGTRGNIQRVEGLLGASLIRMGRAVNDPEKGLSGWAGWRAVLPGRLPAIGPLQQAEGLWVATGFASRGLTWASLAGDLIAAALNDEPLPLERDIIDKISQT